jgi:Leucine-rich repeat (LRR) protein
MQVSREFSQSIRRRRLILVAVLVLLWRCSIGLSAELPEDVLRDMRELGSARKDASGDVFSVYLGGKASDEILEKLHVFPQLRLLNIETAKDITQGGIEAIAKIKSLESLTLYMISLPQASFAPLARLPKLTELSAAECGLTDSAMLDLGKLTQLKSLRIEGNQIGDLGVAALKGLTNLESLNVAQSSWVNSRMQIGDRAMAYVAGFTKLRELDLSRLPVTDEGFAKLSALAELRSLNISGTQITASGLKTLASFPHLQLLEAGGPAINDESMQFVGQCHELRSLMLGGVGDEGFRHVAKLRKLERITITGDRVTDAALVNLTSLGELAHIELRAPTITDEGLKAIAQIDSLERLDLWADGPGMGRPQGGHFTAAGYAALSKMPKLKELWVNQFKGAWTDLRELTNLKVLHLMMPSISQDEVRLLQKALPNVRVSSATGGGGVAPLQDAQANGSGGLRLN